MAASAPSSALALEGAFLLPQTTIELGKTYAYLARPGTPERFRVPVPPFSDLGLSPDGTLLAYQGIRTGEPGAESDSRARYEVGITDLTGRKIAVFQGGVRFAWSEHGEKLAIGIARPDPVIPPFDSVVVWEPERGVTLGRRVSASRGLIGWANTDTLLVGSSVLGPVQALDCRTGIVGPSRHSGTNVSPDGLFSVYPTMDAVGMGVYDERTGANVVYSVIDQLRLPKIESIRPVYWMRSMEGGHILAVSASAPPDTSQHMSSPQWWTGIVDVGTSRLVGWTRGQLHALTSDSRYAVVARDSTLAFVGADDWERGSLPERPTLRQAPKRRPPSSGLVFAFTMQQINCCDNGGLATARGYQSGVVYLLDGQGRSREFLRPSGFWPYQAVLNRSLDLVAMVGQSTDVASLTVLVADTSGSIVAHISGAAGFRWSPDGRRLALKGKHLLVWERRKGLEGEIRLPAEDYAWADSRTIMVRMGKRVIRVNWPGGDTTGTNHQAVRASRDGNYSIDAPSFNSGPRVFDDRMKADITGCSWGNVQGLGWGVNGDPFWSLNPDLPHHLWVNKCNPAVLGIEERKAYGCETSLVDVEAMERLTTIPGKLIGQTPDERSIVVLMGDSLQVLSVDAKESRKRGPEVRSRVAHLHAVVLGWGKYQRSPDTVGVYNVKVSSGDWLPDWSMMPGRCGRGMRVRQVRSSGEVELEHGTSWARREADPDGRVWVGFGAATTLYTPTFDAGEILILSIAPP